jgi:hypothetical protein
MTPDGKEGRAAGTVRTWLLVEGSIVRAYVQGLAKTEPVGPMECRSWRRGRETLKFQD